MISIRRIDKAHEADINIKNQPFALVGRLHVSRQDDVWGYSVERFPPEGVSEMCFPDEGYDYDEMSRDCVFLGAYDGETCVGLAILQRAMFKYLYLYDLKVEAAYRGRGVGRLLIEACRRVAAEQGYRGVYVIGQDNNLNACLFYLRCGFVIGGLDTQVYRGTNQEGKSDVIFYAEATPMCPYASPTAVGEAVGVEPTEEGLVTT